MNSERQTLRERLQEMVERYEQVQARMNQKLADDPEAAASQEVRQMIVELGRLQRPVNLFKQHGGQGEELRNAREVLAEAEGSDEEMQTLARQEIERLQAERDETEAQLRALLPATGDDWAGRDAVLEIRAGTGGDEAALFAADLLRMYQRLAARRGWQWDMVHFAPSEHDGCREAIVLLEKSGCYGALASEAGVHRVQRVPKTEAQGRVHTSTCTVAVLPLADAPEEVALNPEDLRVDTFRASGAGGQHVNKTDSAVRITHLPTGIVVECQDDRSQHRNRAMAMAILSARLLQERRQQQEEERGEQRRSMIGGAQRAEKIRTYNFPQQRITDHRLQRNFHRLSEVMEGDVDELLAAFADDSDDSLREES